MSASENKARALVEEARGKLKPSLFSFFSNKTEEAAELFEKAAGQFKIAKLWNDAGKTYVEAADTYKKAGSMNAGLYAEAAKCFTKCSPAEALKTYRIATELYMEENRFSTAAKMYTTMAELCESDHDLQGAIEAHNQAAECYFTEDSTTCGNQALLQVAHLSAQMEDYTRSIEIYEQVAAASIDNKLLQWGAKDHYFRATLCHLALAAISVDLDNAERALEKYKDVYPAFETSRECKFLVAILDAFKNGDVEKFTDVVYEYDNISKLDNWKTAILLAIKKAITSSGLEEEINLT